MFILWEKKIYSEVFGGHIARVECMKCRCEYFYKLTRVGKGRATAYYGIGTQSATSSAQNQSTKELSERLAVEAELVPCPKCNWINDELVEGYRRSRYRKLATIAVWGAFFGVLVSLICGWFLSIGPAADREAIPYVLIGGPVVLIAIAIGLLGLQRILRSWIQPNQNFPHPPRLPMGTPSALYRDRSTGEFVPADRSKRFFENELIEFQVGHHQLPPVCSQCLEEATGTHGYPCQLTDTSNVQIPWCAGCARIANQKYRLVWVLISMIGIVIPTIVALSLKLESFEFWLLVGSSVLIAFGIAAWIASSMIAPVKVVGRDDSRGVVRLRFRNPEYGQLVWSSTSS